MNRRQFAQSTITTLSAGALLGSTMTANADAHKKKAKGDTFNHLYAPNYRHFRQHVGEDQLDAIQFMYDHGFRGIEDNGMMGREVDLQKRIGKKLEDLGMTMGVFVAYKDFRHPTLSGNRLDRDKRDRDPKALREILKAEMEKTIECAKRVNAKWVTVVPGCEDPSLEPEYQFQNVVDNLKYMAEMLEPHGIVMVLEPLNHMNHPGLFLKRIPQAYAVCKAVGSPSCKILNDLYHQQITEGNLINNIDRAWDETVYFQIGDVPGRREPTTGEINYKNVFKHIYDKGYRGIMGMEHGISQPGKAGEMRLIEAYREVDAFEV